MGYKHIPDAVISQGWLALSQDLANKTIRLCAEFQRLEYLLEEYHSTDEDMMQPQYDELRELCVKWGIPL